MEYIADDIGPADKDFPSMDFLIVKTWMTMMREIEDYLGKWAVFQDEYGGVE